MYNTINEIQITVTCADGAVGEFTLNYHDDRFIADALMDVRPEINQIFGQNCSMTWGTNINQAPFKFEVL